MTFSEVARIGVAVGGPVPLPIWVLALITRTTAQEAVREGISAAAVWPSAVKTSFAVARVRRRVAARVYREFPWPKLIARELGTTAHTVRWWVKRQQREEAA